VRVSYWTGEHREPANKGSVVTDLFCLPSEDRSPSADRLTKARRVPGIDERILEPLVPELIGFMTEPPLEEMP
jgi:hypothetical protein